MSLVTLPSGLLIEAIKFPRGTMGNQALDASGESKAIVGRVRLEGRTGSKTLSAAGGGKIWSGGGSAVTFSNAGSNLRVGIQDVDLTTGLEDGSWDVYGDLTGGGGGYVASVWNQVAMTSGTKTIADGDLVAIVVELTTRGGSDSVGVRHGPVQAHSWWAGTLLFPYATVDAGTLQKDTANLPLFFLQCDDGTYGWIEGGNLCHDQDITRTAFNSGSASDEYAAIFQVPFKCTIDGFGLPINQLAATDDLELILYSDPTGTPVAERTVTPDPDAWVNIGSTDDYFMAMIAAFTLNANTSYALAARPTTANNIGLGYITVGTGRDPLKKAWGIFGASALVGTRANQTGAFTPMADRFMPAFALMVSQIDDGAGGAGGNTYSRGRIVNGGL